MCHEMEKAENRCLKGIESSLELPPFSQEVNTQRTEETVPIDIRDYIRSLVVVVFFKELFTHFFQFPTDTFFLLHQHAHEGSNHNSLTLCASFNTVVREGPPGRPGVVSP